MRMQLRIVISLLIVLALGVPAAAQPLPDRVTVNASVGPSFANLGTTLSTAAGLDVKLNDRVTLVGELGLLPHAPFRDAVEVAPPSFGGDGERVHAFHWNGNLKVRPFVTRRFMPYVTGGVGSFRADVVGPRRTVGALSIQERRRVADFATNLGGGVMYQLNPWIAVGGDYRTFFVHRDGSDPRVHRFTSGLSFFLH